MMVTEINTGTDRTLLDRVKFECLGHSIDDVSMVACSLLINIAVQNSSNKDEALASIDRLFGSMRNVMEKGYDDILNGMRPITSN